MVDTRPAKIGNVNKSVNSSKVNKYSVRSDVFNSTFKYLTFFKLTDNFFLLFFDIGFNKRFVRNHNVFEFVVDFHNFEFHCFSYVSIVITDRLHVYLRTWQECLNSKYIYDHTTFSSALNKTVYDKTFVVSFVHTIPCLNYTSFTVRKN